MIQLNSLGAEMSLLKHPFYQQWTAGRSRRNGWATTPSSTTGMSRLSTLPERIAFALRRARNTACTARKPHRRGARRREPSGTPAQVAQALGLNREKVLAAEPLPAASALGSLRAPS